MMLTARVTPVSANLHASLDGALSHTASHQPVYTSSNTIRILHVINAHKRLLRCCTRTRFNVF